MDVQFLHGSFENPDLDIFLQEMEAHQIGLITEYKEKLNRITLEQKRLLQDYLDLNHPGRVVPEIGHPLFDVLQRSFEDFAILTLELEDVLAKFHEDILLQRSSYAKYGEYEKFQKENPNKFQETRERLEEIRVAMDPQHEKRLDLDRVVRSLTLKLQKIVDMAKKSETAIGTASGFPGIGNDALLLGILKKGILAANRESCENALEPLKLWPCHKGTCGLVLILVNYLIDRLEEDEKKWADAERKQFDEQESKKKQEQDEDGDEPGSEEQEEQQEGRSNNRKPWYSVFSRVIRRLTVCTGSRTDDDDGSDELKEP